MNIREWDERYRTRERAGDYNTDPALLVSQYAALWTPGKALDLAAGTGRNSVYLAHLGWQVTAVDGSEAAIEILNQRSAAVRTAVADLENPEFPIDPAAWDLILSCYYLQRDLIPAMKAGVRPGGAVILIAHTPEPGEEPNYKRAAPGELRTFFEGWEILHQYEGPARDPSHHRPVAEIVAQRPRNSSDTESA